jgi:hypothetical protein
VRQARPQVPQAIRAAVPSTPQPVTEPAPPLRDAATVGLKADMTATPRPAAPVINVPTENAATPATIATSGTIPAPDRASIWADMDPVLYDRAAVRALLDRYRNAYERLDANAAKRVWPGVNQRALERAFSDLEWQTLAFEQCRIDVTNDRGTAHCQGRATYVGRVGTRAPQTQVRDWTFQLSKAGTNWGIDSVRAQ